MAPSISENQTCVMTGKGQLGIRYSDNKSLCSLQLGRVVFAGKGGVAVGGAFGRTTWGRSGKLCEFVSAERLSDARTASWILILLSCPPRRNLQSISQKRVGWWNGVKCACRRRCSKPNGGTRLGRRRRSEKRVASLGIARVPCGEIEITKARKEEGYLKSMKIEKIVQ